MKALLSGGALLLVLTGQALAFSDDRTEQQPFSHSLCTCAATSAVKFQRDTEKLEALFKFDHGGT